MIDEKQFDSVVILSAFFWNDRDDLWQTTHNIAREFARLVPTILVEPPPQWNVFGEQYRGYRLLNCLVHSQTYSPQSNLNVFRRRGLPFGRFPLIRNFDLRRNAVALKAFLAEEGYTRPLLWHSFPYWTEPMTQAVNYSLFVYHCLDHSTREEEEASLIRRANAVFCVSEALVEQHRRLNPHTHLLPNGVDLNLFNRNAVLEKQRPADLPVDRRLIGFVGAINCHLDVELLVQVATAFPHDTVVLVGPVLSNETAPRGRQKEALATVMSLHNVRVLGFKPTIELPLYMQAFDVCLIPFLKDSFNQQADPLKFYQYLAMGKPIVTTSVRVAQRYRALCYIADSTEEFIASISDALSEGSAGNLTERRMAVARAHSWEALVAQACQVLKGMKGNSGISTEGDSHAQL